MTTCAHCGATIAAGAKTCPSCGGKNKKPVYKRPWFIVLMVIIVICAVMGMGGSEEPGSTSTTDNDTQKQEQKITYTEYDLGQMVKELESNAMKAEKKYNEQYIKVTGKISVIDSDGDYIAIEPVGSDFSIYGIQCYIQNEEQEAIITELNVGDSITIEGQITEIGEVMGYSMNIDKVMK